MPNYTYMARDRGGRITRGALAAETPGGLRLALGRLGMQLVSLEVRPEAFAVSTWVKQNCNPLRALPPRSRDIEVALRQLAMMLRSGLDLLNALKAIRGQTSPALARVLSKMIPAISRGQGLAAAMSAVSVFPPIAVQLVSVGEETGKLGQVLEQAAKHIAQRRTAISEVRIALAYPIIVAIAAVSIAVYLVFAVIPELEKFLGAMGRKLPQMTQSLVDLSLWCKVNGATTLVATISAVMAFVLITQWPPGRMVLDRLYLRLPIIGSVLRLSGTAALASSLAVMVRSGIKLVEALKITERLQTNRFLAARVAAARHAVVRGEDFAAALAAPHSYMPMLTSMLDVAQRTGQLDATLDDVAKFCETELQTKIKRLSMLVEPAIIVVAGGIVGYVYMAFFMALISAGGHVK